MLQNSSAILIPDDHEQHLKPLGPPTKWSDNFLTGLHLARHYLHDLDHLVDSSRQVDSALLFGAS